MLLLWEPALISLALRLGSECNICSSPVYHVSFFRQFTKSFERCLTLGIPILGNYLPQCIKEGVLLDTNASVTVVMESGQFLFLAHMNAYELLTLKIMLCYHGEGNNYKILLPKLVLILTLLWRSNISYICKRCSFSFRTWYLKPGFEYSANSFQRQN